MGLHGYVFVTCPSYKNSLFLFFVSTTVVENTKYIQYLKYETVFTCLDTFNRYKQPSPEWSVFREASFGHGELKMVNSTHAFWSWHRNDDDESVRSDQVWITSLIGSGCNTEGSHEMRSILMAS